MRAATGGSDKHKVFPLYCHYNVRDLPHVGDGGCLDGHAVAYGPLVVHLAFGFHSRASCCASAIWAGVIRPATSSRLSAASF
jgi:hypothetical protein